MTQLDPTLVAQRFFEAYRQHDVEAMVDACSECAELHYVPFELWGKQRVLRGDGKVRDIGKVLWTALIHAFPDLSNEITSLHADSSGNVSVEVTLSGTQARVWGPIACKGKRFALPHLFLLRVGDAGAIERINAYWDSADMYRQLGRVEID